MQLAGCESYRSFTWYTSSEFPANAPGAPASLGARVVATIGHAAALDLSWCYSYHGDSDFVAQVHVYGMLHSGTAKPATHLASRKRATGLVSMRKDVQSTTKLLLYPVAKPSIKVRNSNISASKGPFLSEQRFLRRCESWPEARSHDVCAATNPRAYPGIKGGALVCRILCFWAQLGGGFQLIRGALWRSMIRAGKGNNTHVECVPFRRVLSNLQRVGA